MSPKVIRTKQCWNQIIVFKKVNFKLDLKISPIKIVEWDDDIYAILMFWTDK